MAERRANRSPLSRKNDRLGLTLAIFVPLSALPVASNRPTWWLLWSALLAGIAIYQLTRKSAIDPHYRPRFLTYRLAFLVALAVPVWAVVQALPIASFLPGALTRLREGMEGFDPATLSVLPGGGLIGALRFIGYLVFFALMIEVATRRDRAGRMATIIFVGVVAQALWALVALEMLNDFAFWGKTDYLGSATGTFVNRNSLATFLGMGLVLGLGLVAHKADHPRGRVSRPVPWFERLGMDGVLLGVGLLIIFLALYATNSRMGVIASLAGAIVTFVLLRSASGAHRTRVAAESAALVLAAVVLLVMTSQGEALLDRLLYVQRDGVNRLAIYAQTLELIRLRPLTGFGFDAFAPAFEAVRAPPLLGNVYYDLAHNSFLGLWAENGLIVGSLPPLLLALAGWNLWSARRGAEGYGGLAAAGLGVLVLGAVHSVFDFSLEIPANIYLMLAIIAIGMGRNTYIRSSQPAASPVSRDRVIVLEVPQPAQKEKSVARLSIPTRAPLADPGPPEDAR